MSEKTDKAVEKFAQFNCAQSVLTSFSDELGIDQTTALKITSGFGGGMCNGDTCGAVTGAYMAIGLRYGYHQPDPEKKVFVKAQVQHFNQLFIAEHGSVHCKRLLGLDISIPAEAEKAKERNLFSTQCPKFIETAVSLIEKNFSK